MEVTMKQNSELRALAREQLKGSWLPAVGLVLVYYVIIGISGMIVVGPIVLGGPLMFGFYGYFIKKVRGETAKLESLFEGFSGFDRFGSCFLLYLLQAIFIILWTCLLVIPGLIKGLSYSMSYFILRDNPNIGALEAITASRKMMNGHKTKLFFLLLSFIGWMLLCCLSFGIGTLWLTPYVSLSVANFYEDLKQNQQTAVAAA
jgi:uncharacterized membrane protein